MLPAIVRLRHATAARHEEAQLQSQYNAELALFRELRPELRTFALVGFYMSAFSGLEFLLGLRIQGLLSLDPMRASVVLRNMGFIEKVFTLRAFVGTAGAEGPGKAAVISVCLEAEKLAPTRNMVAHSQFGPSDVSDGVRFLGIEGRSKMRVPKHDWSVEEVISRVVSLQGLTMTLESEVVETFVSDLAAQMDEWQAR